MSGEPARIEITRRIEWIDTDAQGITTGPPCSV